MKVNSQNYYEVVKSIGVENLSPAMQKAHSLIDKATQSGTNWKAYTSFKKAFDMQFEALELLLKEKANPTKSKPVPAQQEPAKPQPYKTVQKSAPVKQHNQQRGKHSGTYIKPKVNGRGVELISPEVVFLKRFAHLHNKTKSKDQVLSFIRSIQRAIAEKRIRKGSKYAKYIEDIQKQLIAAYKSMKSEITFKFNEADLTKYHKAGGSEVVMPSIRFIKAYISTMRDDLSKEKAKKLYNRIVDAIEHKKLSESDKYFKHIKVILKSLSDYVKQSSTKPQLRISEAQLNGLEGALKSCGCLHDSLSGIDTDDLQDDVESETEQVPSSPRNTILNSQQVLNLKSDKLNFTGKWLNFIGNPSRGFTAMIYGKPKFGKSYLAVEFAGYLALNYGKVLYIAFEEGFEDTIKQKIEEKKVAHPNLDVSDYVPNNFSGYDFVFIDSVNKAGLSPEDLDKLERKYPKTSFIYIFQTTKDGNFKGGMEYKHNVDVVIEVPEIGLATQYGRYNQGAEMKIFS